MTVGFETVLVALFGWHMVEQVAKASSRDQVASEARAVADSLKKPMLNYGCEETAYGDVNADIEFRNVPNFVLVPPSPEPIPFPDGYFGSALCTHVIEHVEDPEALLSELQRVADHVYITTPSPAFLGAWLTPGHKWVFKADGTAIRIR